MKNEILFFRLIANFIDTMSILLVYILLFNIMKIKTSIGSILLLISTYLIIEIHFWKNSTTLGKNVLNLKVVDKYTYEDITFLDMMIRENIGKIISNILFLGYLYALIDKNNQTFHDKLVNSIVIEY